MAITLTSEYQELNALMYHNNTLNSDIYVCVDAKCVLESSNIYTVSYRLRISQTYTAVPINASSVNNYAMLSGTGATTYSTSGGTFVISNVGNNIIKEISASNISGGSSVSVTGHYFMGNPYNYGNPSGENVTATALVPNQYQAPGIPEIKVEPISADSIEVTYGVFSFGYPNTGTVTLYGGTSPNPTTILDSDASTGYIQFLDAGLTTGSTYYYRAKAENAQVSSDYSVEVAVTVPSTTTHKFYGSDSGDAARVCKMYGSDNDVSTSIVKMYGSENGLTKRIF